MTPIFGIATERVKSLRLGAGALATPLVAVVVFALAYSDGGYSIGARSVFAIAVWWSIMLAVALGVWPLARPDMPARATGALFAAFAVLTGMSILWSASAERSFEEFTRVTLFLGVFLVAVLAATRGNLERWTNGFAVAITGTALLALASRLFPAALPQGDVPDVLAAAATRLSYPLEYWNALAMFTALGLPLLLRIAVASESRAARAAAVAPIPALVAVMYLTSSRGGFAVALIAIVVFVAAASSPWAAAGAAAVAGAGAAAAVAVLLARPQLVDGPLASEAARSQGRSAALLLAAVCIATAAMFVLAAHLVHARVAPGRRAKLAVLAAVAVAAVVVVAAARPVQQFETFKEPPATRATDDFIRSHLLSGSGSGRWQYWSEAVAQWRAHAFAGDGAGSYQAWWTRHRPISLVARDAHSLYLETLGELGILGAAVLVAALAIGLVSGIRRVRRATGRERTAVAAVLAVFVGWMVAAGIDWMWEVTAVTVVGVAALGLLTGPATATSPRLEPVAAPGPPRRRRLRFVVGTTVVVLGWLLICAQAIPLLAHIKLDDSQAAARRGDFAQALRDALAARNVAPWAASPYLQLALVEEEAGELGEAKTWIDMAVERDATDWRLWLAKARIETKRGDIAASRAALARAAALNPRSPLFTRLDG